jgi:hypothetical protein
LKGGRQNSDDFFRQEYHPKWHFLASHWVLVVTIMFNTIWQIKEFGNCLLRIHGLLRFFIVLFFSFLFAYEIA